MLITAGTSTKQKNVRDGLWFVRGLLGTAPQGPHPSNPPRPPLFRGRFGIEIGSNQEIDVESMLNGYQIDPEEVEDEVRGLCLISPSQALVKVFFVFFFQKRCRVSETILKGPFLLRHPAAGPPWFVLPNVPGTLIVHF